MSQQFTIRMPDDFHTHFRQGKMLQQVAPITAQHFGRATIMPNTEPPILTAHDAMRYQEEILQVTAEQHPWFTPLMTIKLTMRTTAQMIVAAKDMGVTAAKLYPIGATTNSQDGVDLNQLSELDPVFAAMAEHGMLLLVHAENPSKPVLTREPWMIDSIEKLRDSHPQLKIVIEHVSTKLMAEYVAKNRLEGNLAATVTLHHLYLTLDDLLGNKLRPDYYCMPVVKQAEDVEYLWHCLKYDNFFFGSDSAPHVESSKLTHACAAGVFAGEDMLPLLAQLFATTPYLRGSLPDRIAWLEVFVSERGSKFYGLQANARTITLEQCDEPLSPLHPIFFGDSSNRQVVLPMPLREGDELFWRVV